MLSTWLVMIYFTNIFPINSRWCISLSSSWENFHIRAGLLPHIWLGAFSFSSILSQRNQELGLIYLLAALPKGVFKISISINIDISEQLYKFCSYLVLPRLFSMKASTHCNMANTWISYIHVCFVCLYNFVVGNDIHGGNVDFVCVRNSW